MRILHVFTIISTPMAFFDGQFRFLSERGFDIHLITSPSENGMAFADHNKISYHAIPISRHISPITDLNAIRQIRKYISENNIDIVVGHTPKGALVAMLASFISGTKKRVYYRHGVVYTTASGIRRFFLKNEERLVSALATDIVNVSESLSKLAIKDSINSQDKQIVIGKGTCGGIDAMRLFNPAKIDSYKLECLRKRLRIFSNCFVFGFVGRLCKDKGIIELYQGFKLFRNRNLSLHSRLLLVGRIDDRDLLPEYIINQLRMDPEVIMTGEVEREEIPYYYSIMDAFVFPSYREGFGMSVIEASAMEKPVLVSRSHGCIDSIEEGITGEYIAITPEGICRGFEGIMDVNKRMDYGVEGRKRVLRFFDNSVLWPEIERYYSTLL